MPIVENNNTELVLEIGKRVISCKPLGPYVVQS